MTPGNDQMNTATSRIPDAESRLLLRCCAQSGPAAALAPLRDRGVDWNRFLALANRNCVTPMIGARLGAEGVVNLPAHVARALRLSYQVNALRCAHLAACAAEIVDSFAATGVPAIAIKGPALALAAYGDLAMRVYGDLDFMVRPSDLPRAAAALARVGYSSAYRADAVESGFFPDATLDFSRQDSVVDLHWRLSPSYFPFAPAGDQVWNRTADLELARQTRSRARTRPTRFCFRPATAASTAGRRLPRSATLPACLRPPRLSIGQAFSTTRGRTRSLRMLSLGADLAHSLELCEVPAELLDAARRDPHVAVAQLAG